MDFSIATTEQMKTKPTIVKAQALKVSKAYRANKFKRVGKDFIEQVDADVDAYLRKLNSEIRTADELIEPTTKLYTPEAAQKILEVLNRKTAAAIQNRVKAHPSMGQTLQG